MPRFDASIFIDPLPSGVVGFGVVFGNILISRFVAGVSVYLGGLELKEGGTSISPVFGFNTARIQAASDSVRRYFAPSQDLRYALSSAIVGWFSARASLAMI